MTSPLDTALAALGRGDIVIIADDGRGADLMMAAELATPDRLAFFVRHSSGFVCTALTDACADRLQLQLMVSAGAEQNTAFTVTVDAARGTTTGISAGDRATTIRALADPATRPTDLARPGHVNVMRARAGGVLGRPGHAEAAVDLARLAGLQPAGVICEIVTADGQELAKQDEVDRFGHEHALVSVSVADVVAHRLHSERLVERAGVSTHRTDWGEFECHAYESALDGASHLALVRGSRRHNVVIAVHTECTSGDVFGSDLCECADRRLAAMTRIAREDAGVFLYMDGRARKPRGAHQAYGDMDLADAAHILLDLGVSSARIFGGAALDLRGYGLEVRPDARWRNETLTGRTQSGNRHGIAL